MHGFFDYNGLKVIVIGSCISALAEVLHVLHVIYIMILKKIRERIILYVVYTRKKLLFKI